MYRRMVLGVAWALALTCTTIGCGSPILRADFESDVVGAMPRHDIPGNPVGDSISALPTARVIIAPAGLSGNSLRFESYVRGLYTNYLIFTGRETSPSAQQFWVVWSAVPQLTDDVPLYVNVRLFPYEFVFHMTYLNGRVFVRDENTSDDTQFGTFRNGQAHGVVIKVDKLNSTYQISVHGSPASSTGVRPIGRAPIPVPDRPSLNFSFLDARYSTSNYVIDDVLMTEACPTDRGFGACE